MYYILYGTTMYMYRTALIRHVHVLSQYKLHIRFETTFTAAGVDERGHSSGRWGCQGCRMAHPLAARSSKAQWRAFLQNLVDTEDPDELTQRSVWWTAPPRTSADGAVLYMYCTCTVCIVLYMYCTVCIVRTVHVRTV